MERYCGRPGEILDLERVLWWGDSGPGESVAGPGEILGLERVWRPRERVWREWRPGEWTFRATREWTCRECAGARLGGAQGWGLRVIEGAPGGYVRDYRGLKGLKG